MSISCRRALATFVFCCAAALLPATESDAAPILIDFDTYPDGSPVPSGLSVGGQWSSLGVVFADLAGGPANASSNACSLSAPNHAVPGLGGTTIVAVFVDPTTGGAGVTDFAGTAQDNCWAPGEGIAMRAYDINGALLGALFNSGAGNFSSFSFSGPIIARLEMDPIGQGIDNFQFNAPTAAPIPEPATGALVFLGTMGLARLRSKRLRRRSAE